MTKKNNVEKWNTAVNICKDEGLTLDDVGAVCVVYKAMLRATKRVGHDASYQLKRIKFLIGNTQKSATVNVIHSHHFEKVKQLYKQYVESDFNPDFIIELDRIDNNGHYSLDNINFITKADHAKKSAIEKSIPVTLFGFVEGGGIQIDTFKTKDSAMKSLKVAHKTLNTMIDNTCIYRDANDNIITYLQMELMETVPDDVTIKGSKTMDEYIDFIYSELQRLNQLYSVKPTDSLAKQIKELSAAIARCEMKLQASNTIIEQ